MKKLFAIVLCLAMCFSLMALSASADGTTYYVAGSASLCNGKEWDPAASENAMSDPDGDGIYSITYTNVPAGTYEFKVTDGSWNNCWPGSNYKLTLDSACDVTIHFNSATTEVTVDAAAQGVNQAPTVTFMGIRGQDYGDLSWETDLVMTEVSTGVYEYTFENIPGGTWPTIKFTANGAWDYNFGCADNTVGAVSGAATEAVLNGQNIWFEVAEASNVTVRLDLSAYDYNANLGATFTVTIVPVSTEPGAPVEPSEPEEPVVPDETNPKDGDPIAMVFALMAASAAGIAVVSKKKEF